MTDIPEIHNDGKTFRLPFARLLRPLTPDEFAALDSSIVRNKVQERIITYTSPLWGQRCVINGANRLRIATDRGMVCPVGPRGEMGDDAARELAIELNCTGRKLSPDEIATLREHRNEAILLARDLGESLRSVAARFHLSHVQVIRILRAALGGTHVPSTPARIKKPPVPLPPFDSRLASGQRFVVRLRAFIDQISAAEQADDFAAVCAPYGGPVAVERALSLLDKVLSDMAARAMGANVVCGGN
jgi:hypothetical protein